MVWTPPPMGAAPISWSADPAADGMDPAANGIDPAAGGSDTIANGINTAPNGGGPFPGKSGVLSRKRPEIMENPHPGPENQSPKGQWPGVPPRRIPAGNCAAGVENAAVPTRL